MTKQMADFLAKRVELVNKGEALSMDSSKTKDLVDITNQIKELDNAIRAREDFENQLKNNTKNLDNNIAVTLENDATVKPEAKKVFKNLADQLHAVVKTVKTGVIDKRLAVLNNASGVLEGNGEDGGFAVQTDFVQEILESVIETSPILSLASIHEVSSPSNSASFFSVNEDDATKGVYGGVAVNWASEGEGADASKPKFKKMKLDLEKLMGFAYVTDETLEDIPFMNSILTESFSLGCEEALVSAMINGDGKGKPLGVLKSDALVAVSKEKDQEAKTIVAENLLKMWGTMLSKYRKNAVWLMHPDCAELLPKLTLPVGQGGVSVFLPATGISGNQYDTLFGRPIVYDHNCSALGDVGDIMLVDWKQYIIIKKGQVKKDWSMHVEFLTAQNCFRIILRCNGAPKFEKQMKIKNSETKRSPYVALAARR